MSAETTLLNGYNSTLKGSIPFSRANQKPETMNRKFTTQINSEIEISYKMKILKRLKQLYHEQPKSETQRQRKTKEHIYSSYYQSLQSLT